MRLSRIAAGFALLTIVAAANSAAADDLSPITWKAQPELSVPSASPPSDPLATAWELRERGHAHFVIRLDRTPDQAERAALRAAGLQLLRPLGHGAYFAGGVGGGVGVPPAVPGGVGGGVGVPPGGVGVPPANLWPASLRVVELAPLAPALKLHPQLTAEPFPDWAIVRSDADGDPLVAVYLLFHSDVPLRTQGIPAVMQCGATVRDELHTVNGLVLELPRRSIADLARLDAVQWIEPVLPRLSPTNNSNRARTGVEILQAPPYGLDGSGVTVLLYDGGTAEPTHPDFGGRLTPRDESRRHDHPTHVGGTIGGDGFASSGLYRGMAPGVLIESYGYEYDGSGTFLYTNPGDIEHDYGEAILLYGAAVANSSIGTNTCGNLFDCNINGDYGVTAQVIDAIVAGGLGRPIRSVWSNGNERGCGRCRNEGAYIEEEYHSTAPPACAKNSISVGALNSNDDSMTFFTSWGPTDDGRIKPDLAAPGCQTDDDEGVTSVGPDEGYLTACGTSMAAPTVTGIAALLLQDFRAQHPDRPDFLPSTLKALLAHTAADVEEPGPDYKTGFGSVRAQAAVDFLRSGHFVEDAIDQDGVVRFLVAVEPGAPEIKITLAWADVPATLNVPRDLVNDLDLVVYDPADQQAFPWTLDPTQPSLPATQTQADHRNIIEQIYVALPTAGLWRVAVRGFEVPAGPQRFSLCASPALARDCDADGISDADEIAAQPDLDCPAAPNGLLDACEPDCNDNGVADSCDIALGTSGDCNENGLADECESDCNGNDVPDDCDLRDGFSADCDVNGVPDECDPDCNANGLPDGCEIVDGIAADCDLNGVPDECQDTTADCNANGTWDACDIFGGTSADEDGNGVPDECEPARTLHVDDDALADPGPGDPYVSDALEDGSLEHPFDAIAKAIAHAKSGDEIVVADGVYRGIGNRDLDFAGRVLVLRSAAGPANCILDAEYQRQIFRFASGESRAAVVEGFTLTHGYGSRAGAIMCLGGAAPTFRHCEMRENRAGFGGAAYVAGGASPLFEHCVLRNNVVNYNGGALLISTATAALHDCDISDNEAGGLGGVLLSTSSGTAEFVRCTLARNTSGTSGGALRVQISSTLTLDNCLLLDNVATGFRIEDGEDVIVQSGSGGALTALSSTTTIVDSTLVGNRADGFEDATEGGYGGALYIYGGTATIRSTILWDNQAFLAGDELALAKQAAVAVAYASVGGGSAAAFIDSGAVLDWGAGNLEGDPRLAADRAHLLPTSPCRDRGDPQLGTLTETDLDGEPRVMDGRIDIGADETPGRPFVFGDMNCDGVRDGEDIWPFVLALVDRIAYEQAYPGCDARNADVNADGVVNNADVAGFVQLLGGSE